MRCEPRTLPALDVAELDRFFGVTPARAGLSTGRSRRHAADLAEPAELATLGADDQESGTLPLIDSSAQKRSDSEDMSDEADSSGEDDGECGKEEGRLDSYSGPRLVRRRRPPPLDLARSGAATETSRAQSVDAATPPPLQSPFDDASSCLEAEIERGQAIVLLPHRCLARPIQRIKMGNATAAAGATAQGSALQPILRSKRSLALQRLKGLCGDLFTARGSSEVAVV